MENMIDAIDSSNDTTIVNDDEQISKPLPVSEQSLIVRVKRKKWQEPMSNLCITDDQSDGSRAKRSKVKFADLSTDNSNNSKAVQPQGNSGKQLIVRRLGTVESSNSEIDSLVVTSLIRRKRERSHDDSTVGDDNKDTIRNRNNKHFLLKCMRTAVTDSHIVVDIKQLYNADNEEERNQYKKLELLKAPQANAKDKGIPVLDPATRKIASSIDTAMHKDDFNPMAEAILMGGNINYQKAFNTGGQTCLMVAAMHANTRMVQRLLSKGANVQFRDSSGRLAIDFITSSNVTGMKQLAATQIIMMLQNAMTASLHDRYNRIDNSDSLMNNSDDDVVDIFMISTATNKLITSTTTDIAPSITSDAEQMNIDNNNSSSSSSSNTGVDDGIMYPTIQVDGLKIYENGNMEVLHAYDSDWSDLGDDEDPDSNDERYFGNDYPDEEDSDNEKAMYASAHDDDDFIDSDEEDRRFPRFQRNNVGRVVHHSVSDDPQGISTKEQLTKLWNGRMTNTSKQAAGDDDNSDDDASNDSSDMYYQSMHDTPLKVDRDRIANMREGTGMSFASQPREFGSEGLAKYGVDLSDDEQDERRLQTSYAQLLKPSKDSIAFDSYLDMDGDDDI